MGLRKNKKVMRSFLPKNKNVMGIFLPKNKKGIEILHNTLVFILLNIVFFAVMFGFVSRAGSGATTVEQVYAKQIALIIDQAKPGTSVSLNIEEVYELADKNKFSRGGVIRIDNNENKVYVQVDEGRGYSYNFFNSQEIVWELKNRELFLEVKLKNE